MAVILTTQEAGQENLPGKIACEIPSQKYPTQNRAGRVAQEVECLSSKCEALS
jgi:hypothetical protein